MIIDLPDSTDFENAGLSLLNTSLDIVFNLLRDLDEAEYLGIDVEEEKDEYWRRSMPLLFNSFSVAQQAFEFILKSKICEISPYLLISGGPKEWPRQSSQTDKKFSEFKTIDAHDLIQTINTFSIPNKKISSTFEEKFNKFRNKRNIIQHSIDNNLNIEIKEILLYILELYTELFPSETILKFRRKFIDLLPLHYLHSTDTKPFIIWEFSILCKFLTPSETKKYLNFQKNQRHYYCETCLNNMPDADNPIQLSYLKPKSHVSTNLYCFICDMNYPVLRQDCVSEECLGNVIYIDSKLCATCMNEN